MFSDEERRDYEEIQVKFVFETNQKGEVKNIREYNSLCADVISWSSDYIIRESRVLVSTTAEGLANELFERKVGQCEVTREYW